MQIFKKISHSVLLSFVFVNLALADTVPVACPQPKDIQTPTIDSKEHSIPKLKCIEGMCVWEQTNRFGTDFHWHFYIYAKDDSTKDHGLLNTQINQAIGSLAYASGPLEEQPSAVVCHYTNNLNFNALAIYMKEIKCPSPSNLIEQKDKGQTRCDWVGNCSYTLADRFDSDFTWNFKMDLRAWSESDGQNRVSTILPTLTYSYIRRKNNLNTCVYETPPNTYYSSDYYIAQATYDGN
jgi:hypothetical protein